MPTLKNVIAELIGNARRAVSGDSGKAIAAIAAIQWGSATVRQIADDAAERAQVAGQELAQLTAALEAGHAAIAERVDRGDHDDVILDRMLTGRFDNAVMLMIADGRYDKAVLMRATEDPLAAEIGKGLDALRVEVAEAPRDTADGWTGQGTADDPHRRPEQPENLTIPSTGIIADLDVPVTGGYPKPDTDADGDDRA